MWACVVNHHSMGEVYSSFHRTPELAIAYAETMMGVIRVEKAHANEAPIWVR